MSDCLYIFANLYSMCTYIMYQAGILCQDLIFSVFLQPNSTLLAYFQNSRPVIETSVDPDQLASSEAS